MSSLNHSPTKAQFSFSKEPRFGKDKEHYGRMYNLSTIERSRESGDGKPFMSSLKDRFGYYPSKKGSPMNRDDNELG